MIVTVHSENDRFYMKSVPFDNEWPTLRGKTSVFAVGNPTSLYVIDRGFDSVERDSNNLILSNDGETIFFALPWGASEDQEGLKSITIYRHGRILKSYTQTDVSGCDLKQERCSLLYSNFDAVVDRERSGLGTPDFRKVFKEGIDAKERFLSDFPIFSLGNTVYLTDSKRKTHLFDLETGRLVTSVAFDTLYNQMANPGRLTRMELERIETPVFFKFPDLSDGRAAEASLAEHLGMKTVDVFRKADDKYKRYCVTVNANIRGDGRLEVESLEVDPDLPKDRILEFFLSNTFDRRSIPAVFESWNLGDEYFFFRKSDNRLARKEKKVEEDKDREEYVARLTAETIDGVYIPKDLGDCFVALDKILSKVDMDEMRALPNRDGMVRYHLGLGMWLRNHWELWGGSRLQKYFTDRGVHHPDDMSGLILRYYYDWLNGRQDAWKDWEKAPEQR